MIRIRQRIIAAILGTVLIGVVFLVALPRLVQPGHSSSATRSSPSSLALAPAVSPAPRTNTPSPSASPTTSKRATSGSPSGSTPPGSGSTPFPTPAPISANGLAIRVAGNHLVDSGGQPIVLRGANLAGAEFACDQGPTAPYGWSIFGGPNDQPATAQAMANWNMNAVRVTLNEDCWLGINDVKPAYGGVAYQKAIENLAQVYHQAGFYVILTLQWSAPGPFPAQGQNPMPDMDHSPAFWSSIAAAFHNDPAVLFDLHSEPFIYGNYFQDPKTSMWDCWLHGCGMNQYITGKGGSDYTAPYNWQTAGMQTLINSIRSTGAKQPILVPGADWANDLSGWLSHRPSDPQHALAASWHSYNKQPCAVASCWTNVIQPLAAQVPIVVGETGDNVCTPTAFAQTFLPWADAQGLSYMGWTFNPWSGYCHDVLIKDWSGTPSANWGQWFYAHLRSLPSINPIFH